MPDTHAHWTVLPHEELVAVDDTIMTAVGYIPMPLARLPRRMTVVRLRDGGLVVYSAIALDDKGMATLERFGTPAFLVVPSDKHRMDAQLEAALSAHDGRRPAWRGRQGRRRRARGRHDGGFR